MLDPRPVGTACTLHGSGLLWKLIWNEPAQYKLAMEAKDELLELIPQLEDESGIDVELHSFDTILPIFNDDDQVALDRDVSTSSHDISLQWLDQDGVLACEPRINREVRRGAVLENSAQVDGYKLSLAFASGARRKGARFYPLKVVGLEREGDRVTSVIHTAGRISCDAVVMCMGAWAGAATAWLDFPVPIYPLLGETIRMTHPDQFPMKVSRPTGGGATPRVDGLLMVGATGTSRFNDLEGSSMKLELQCEPTISGYEEMIAPSVHVLPDLARGKIVYHLAGPRPLSADGMPMIGPIPGTRGAYVATGHRNKGIHLSAFTARIIRDFVLTGNSVTKNPLDCFKAERFAGQENIQVSALGITDELRRML